MQWQLQEKKLHECYCLFQQLNQVDLFVHSVICNIYQYLYTITYAMFFFNNT